ncbi:Exosome complex component RRP4 [Physocladia obscura]|uniref:Exosome complex component RRP4 n=1 Tax=Physocladia obscura TaxID=109957 RepID=A0AAD5T5J0_9FUNG|nr:Exosome complex component RRP4 [Physocladia obscura]
MEIESTETATTAAALHRVTPGETVTTDASFMRGHGTYAEADVLVATVVGYVERINKLISVRPVRQRYGGDIGDVVVGRISEVGQKRWRVDIGARQDAQLLLAAVNLPGGELRRRSESDELQMRHLLSEGDLISAEIQAFYGDGAASLHTRSLKYGKVCTHLYLRSGSFITVPSSLIKRSKAHFLHFSFANAIFVDVIVGMNGFIFVSKGTGGSNDTKTDNPQQQQQDVLYSNENEPISDDERIAIARVSNCILALAKENELITEPMILQAYEASTQMEAYDILENSQQIVDVAKMNL